MPLGGLMPSLSVLQSPFGMVLLVDRYIPSGLLSLPSGTEQLPVVLP